MAGSQTLQEPRGHPVAWRNQRARAEAKESLLAALSAIRAAKDAPEPGRTEAVERNLKVAQRAIRVLEVRYG